MDETTTVQPSGGSGQKVLWIVLGVVVLLIVLGSIVARSVGFMAMKSAGVDVDRKGNGSVTYSNNDASVTVGAGANMPANWPSDAPPAYAGATIMYSGTSNPQTGKAGSAVMYNTSASMQSVAEYYTTRLKAEGWTIEGTANMGGTQVISAKKDTRTIGISITDAGDGTVSVTAGVGF